MLGFRAFQMEYNTIVLSKNSSHTVNHKSTMTQKQVQKLFYGLN